MLMGRAGYTQIRDTVDQNKATTTNKCHYQQTLAEVFARENNSGQDATENDHS